LKTGGAALIPAYLASICAHQQTSCREFQLPLLLKQKLATVGWTEKLKLGKMKNNNDNCCWFFHLSFSSKIFQASEIHSS
jgi:hypothetical protein